MAERGSREETCTSQPFAPRRPIGTVTAGPSGVDITSSGTMCDPNRAARVALGKRPRFDREGEAEPSGSSAANARRCVSIARACASTRETSRSRPGGAPAREDDPGGNFHENDAEARVAREDVDETTVSGFTIHRTDDVRAALDLRDIDEGVAWLRQCHARLIRIFAATMVARARARVVARGARAAARGVEAARVSGRPASAGCARLRPFTDRGARSGTSSAADYRVGGLGSTPRPESPEQREPFARETAAALAARARAKRLFVPARRAKPPCRASRKAPSLEHGTNGCLAGSPLRGAAGVRRLREAQSLFRVDRSRVHGFGVFAREAVPKGTPVMEYVGEVVRRPIADRRERAALDARVSSTYMFALDENDADSRVVDATRKGNLARFVNHSCAPNCETKSIVLANERRVVLFATRDVRRGEELTYDYQFAPECPERETPCACGAATCRGIMNVRA